MSKNLTIEVVLTGEAGLRVRRDLVAALFSTGHVVGCKIEGVPQEHSQAKSDHYLVSIEGDVQPHLHGPYSSDEQRMIHARMHNSASAEDPIYRLDVSAGTPSVSMEAITDGELEEQDLVSEICISLRRGEQNWARIATSDYLTFQFLGEEVLVSESDVQAVAQALQQDLYVLSGATQDYVATSDMVKATYTETDWRKSAASGQTTLGYHAWVNEQMDQLETLAFWLRDEQK